MKNRNIPYGYCYENGMVVIQPSEAQILCKIFQEYLQGLSLLKIAEQLNIKKVEYMPSVTGWNKARIMRIIEDKRYLGTDVFPAIIDAETHEKLQRLKLGKNTQKNTDRSADIFQLNVPVNCPNCGCEMHRRNDCRRKIAQRWICQNVECKTTIEITDNDLLQCIAEILNIVIGNPDIINIEKDESTPTDNVSRLNYEISHTLETYSFNKEELRKKMLECVSLKYKEIASNTYIAKKMKADFEKSSPLSFFSADLCYRTVQSVQLNTDGKVTLTLINGQEIGKEDKS